MADRNVCVTCGSPATYFCLCTSMKTLMCATCLPAHITTRGAHLISPLSAQSFIRKAEDLDRYNSRLHVVEELTSALDDVSKKLDSERKTVTRTITDIQSEMIMNMKAAFSQVQRDIELMYDSIKTSLKLVREEIVQASTSATVKLSEETLLFTSAASHMREKRTQFVNVSNEIARRIMLEIAPEPINVSQAFTLMLGEWACKSPTCFSCAELKRGLELAIEPPTVAEEASIFKKFFGAKVKSSLSDQSAKARFSEQVTPTAGVQTSEEKKEGSYFLQ